MIYPRFLVAHGRYLNNDQIPLYFAQQLYTEFRIGLNVNYLDIPDYCGQGRGRIVDRDQYHSAHRLPPVDIRQFVGQRMPPVTPAHAPIADRVVIASQRGAIDTVGHFASAAASITSDSIDRYIRSRHSHPLGRPSS